MFLRGWVNRIRCPSIGKSSDSFGEIYPASATKMPRRSLVSLRNISQSSAFATHKSYLFRSFPTQQVLAWFGDVFRSSSGRLECQWHRYVWWGERVVDWMSESAWSSGRQGLRTDSCWPREFSMNTEDRRFWRLTFWLVCRLRVCRLPEPESQVLKPPSFDQLFFPVSPIASVCKKPSPCVKCHCRTGWRFSWRIIQGYPLIVRHFPSLGEFRNSKWLWRS